ncbi:MAG: hypothetical protein ACFB20_05905 [Opitutales bacterium]
MDTNPESASSPEERNPRRDARAPSGGAPAPSAGKRYPGPHEIDGTAKRIAGQIEEERLQHGSSEGPEG